LKTCSSRRPRLKERLKRAINVLWMIDPELKEKDVGSFLQAMTAPGLMEYMWRS